MQDASTNMKQAFEQYAEIGDAFIRRLGIALGQEHDPEKTLRILKRVFAGLRSHLPFYESVSVIETLPMAIRGFYVDGWELLSGSPKITTVDDFAVEIMRPQVSKGRDLNHTEGAILAARSVIETIAHFVYPGAPDGSTDRLPRGLRNLYDTLTRISRRNDYTYPR